MPPDDPVPGVGHHVWTGFQYEMQRQVGPYGFRLAIFMAKFRVRRVCGLIQTVTPGMGGIAACFFWNIARQHRLDQRHRPLHLGQRSLRGRPPQGKARNGEGGLSRRPVPRRAFLGIMNHKLRRVPQAQDKSGAGAVEDAGGFGDLGSRLGDLRCADQKGAEVKAEGLRDASIRIPQGIALAVGAVLAEDQARAHQGRQMPPQGAFGHPVRPFAEAPVRWMHHQRRICRQFLCGQEG